MSYLPASITDAAAGERERRDRRLMLARVSSRRIADQEIVIRNVSKRGLGATTHGILPTLAEQVTITLLDGQTLLGVVRWAGGHAFGLCLDDELNPEALADIQSLVGFQKPENNWEVGRLHRVITPSVEVTKLRRI
jgi:hypothetical protein